MLERTLNFCRYEGSQAQLHWEDFHGEDCKEYQEEIEDITGAKQIALLEKKIQLARKEIG